MSIFSGGDRESNFIEFFYKRDLSERDLYSFDKEKMKVSKISKIFRNSLGEQELRALYHEVERCRGRVNRFQDGKEIVQCNKNMQKLAALAWPEGHDISPFAVDSSDSEGLEPSEEKIVEVRGFSEEETLEAGGFSRKEALEIITMIKDLPRLETVSVVDPSDLTDEEQEKIDQKEEKGILVSVSPVSNVVARNREKKSLGRFDQSTRHQLVEGPVSQIAKDFDRDLRVCVLTDRGINRFDPKQVKGGLISEAEARAAAMNLMHCIEDLPGLTVEERVFVFANSDQNLFGEAAIAFQLQILPKIQVLLSQKKPEGDFHATFRGKSDLVHDVRKKQTTFSQIVTVGDLNLMQGGEGEMLPLILQFRMGATLDWKTEVVTLDPIKLISSDASPLRGSLR